MHFFKTLLAGAALVASTVAQSGELAFTSFPSDVVTPGTPVDLTWSGGESGAPVTITLRRGPSDNLQDVAVLTSSATGGSYTWTPSEDLESGDNYALQISQGGVINYTGQFSVDGKESGDDAPAPTYAPGGASTTVVTVTLTTNCETSTPSGKHPTNVPRPSSKMPQPPKSTGVVPTRSHPPVRPTETTPPYTGGAASTVFSTPLALAVAALGAFAYIN